MKEKTNSKKQNITGALVLVVIVAIIYATCSDSDAAPLSAAEQHKKRIEEQFSAWDGSHTNLKKMIKDNMNDPDSYENVETNYFDMDSFVIINQTYTGKNAFGGRVKGFVKAKADTLGNIIEIIEQR